MAGFIITGICSDTIKEITSLMNPFKVILLKFLKQFLIRVDIMVFIYPQAWWEVYVNSYIFPGLLLLL